MSISGPSALGTLLVQRLDAVLGTTLSQQTNLASGARPDAVTQPGQPLSPDPAQNQTTRDSRSAVDKTIEQAGQQLRQAVDKTKLDAQQALLAGRDQPSTSTTPSAPTTLGTAAKAILALLMNYPDKAPALNGKTPLVGLDSGAAQGEAGPARQAAQGATGTPASPAATSMQGAAAGAPAASATAGAASGQQTAQSTGAPIGAAGSSPSAVAGGAPGPAVSAAQFAQALSQALQGSGLFYESHLNNAAFGKQSIASLHTEPQAHLGQNTAAASAASSASTPGTGDAAGRPAPGETFLQAQNAANAAPQQGQAAAPSSALAGLHPDTHLLVRQQLEVLANQTMAWRGEAWPNAPMQWEVRREGNSPGQENDGDGNHWATRLTLHLPNLGEVQARINLAGQQIVMQIVAPESAHILDESRDALRTQLLSSGLQISALSIHENGPAGDTPSEQAGPSPLPPQADPS